MSALLSSFGSVLRLGPKEYVRQKFKLPLVKFIHDTINLYKTRTKAGVNNIREVLFRGTVIALLTAFLVWLSIFMYIAFYYVYVPAISHERPVYLKFKPCGATDDCIGEKGVCSFPSAHVKLTKKQQLLMMGQSYKIHLDLDMPESPANRQLGMFMVCVEMTGQDGTLINSSCRSAMLHYKGFLLDTLYKLVFIPFFVLGSSEEKQNVKVELFADYEEKYDEPVTDIYIEIQTRHIEIYSAKFSVNAQFSGLRYVMFHWPFLSAAMGITANLFFVALVCMISWYQIIHSEEYLHYIENSTSQQKDNEETFLPKIFDSDLGTVPFIPMFVGLDICSSLAYNFANKIIKVSSAPIKMLKFLIEFSEYNYFSTKLLDTVDANKVEPLATEGIPEETHNLIICAKHKESGCESCLDSDSSYSVDYDDTSLLEEKDLRFRGEFEREEFVETLDT